MQYSVRFKEKGKLKIGVELFDDWPKNGLLRKRNKGEEENSALGNLFEGFY